MVIRKNITIDGVNFHQQSLLSGKDYIIKATNTVSVKLSTLVEPDSSGPIQ
jgi:hypothetical protein